MSELNVNPSPPTYEDAQAEYDATLKVIDECMVDLHAADLELVALNLRVTELEKKYADANLKRTEALSNLHELLDVIVVLKHGTVPTEGYYGALNRNDLRARLRPPAGTPEDPQG